MTEAINVPLAKTIYIDVDSTTITRNIQLLLTFEDMGSGSGTDSESVAWKVADVIYSGKNKEVPIAFDPRLAFAIASEKEGMYIQTDQTVDMDLQDTVDIREGGDQQLVFKNKIVDDRLQNNQICTWNNAGRPVGVSVGFLEGRTINSVEYISDLGHKNQWRVTYKPELKIYVTGSNARQGQTIKTIVKGSDVIHNWNMDTVLHRSRWLLKMEESGEYTISKE